MQTMTAAVLNAAPGGLQIEQLPIPEPRANEVLVKVHSCGVCHTDLHVMKAEVAFPTPAVMGHEISGTVVALGPGVKGPAVGTRVVSAFVMPCGFCPACGAGRDDLCENFFGMNRLKGTLFDGTTRLRRADGTPGGDVLDGGHGGVLGRSRHRRLPAARQPAARGVGGARLRGVHRLRRRAACGRPARRRAHRGRGHRRRRADDRADRQGVRRVADHRGGRARRQARGGPASSAPPTW